MCRDKRDIKMGQSIFRTITAQKMIVPHQVVNLGTVSLSCKRRLKSVVQFPFFQKLRNTISKWLKCIHLNLWRKMWSCACASNLVFEKLNKFFLKCTFSLSTTRHIYTKLLTFFEISVKVKVRSL